MDLEERRTAARILRLVPLVLLVALVAWCTQRRTDPSVTGASRAELMELMLLEGLVDAQRADLNQAAQRAGEVGMNRLLYRSAETATVEALQWMVKHGADPANIGAMDKGTLLQRAARRPTLDRLSYFVDTLHLDPKADTPDHVTPLMIAAEAGVDTQTVRYLVSKGVRFDAKDGAGRTAMHYAQGKSIPALIDAGASINGVDGQGRTALHAAADDSRVAAVAELIRLGASVFAVDRDGNTPLHLAATRDNDEVVDLLLAAGAPKAARNQRGMTPRELYLADRESARYRYNRRIDRTEKL